MPKVMYVDVETYSPVSLPDCGVYIYAAHPEFELLLFGYAFDDDPVTVIDLAQGQSIPDEILAALVNPEIVKSAFNANFERVTLEAALGMRMEPEGWTCSQMLSTELGLPDNLSGVGTALKLPQNVQKDKAGKALIEYFCSPCKPTQRNGGRERNLPAHAPARWADFVEYNRQDVVAERAIRQKLLKYEIPRSEYLLWQLDQQINDRGVKIDLQLATHADAFDDRARVLQEERFAALTGGIGPKSHAAQKRWIKDTCGVEVESLNKDNIDEVRAACNNPLVDEMLDIRAELNKTSTKKYGAMLRMAGTDDRARGCFKFYGASTGRWAGRGIQLQNLPKNLMPDIDLDIARQLVRDDDYDTFWLLYSPADTLSQLLRTALIPKPGTRFIVADFSAIEARITAWLAGEQWRMDVFNSDGKIYEASAEQMFNLPPGSVKKGDPMRARGKVAELALGFGAGTGGLIRMGALREGLAEDELQSVVDRWRAASPGIVKLWRSTEAAAKNAITTKRQSAVCHGAAYYMDGPLLRLRLPSGRAVSYVRPQVQQGEIRFESQYQKTWTTTSAWYGTLTENLVQATARDCLAAAMLALDAAGYEIVAHCHDEVIIEAPPSVTVKEVCEIMGQALPWAPGLPLRADGYECDVYRKD